MENNPKKSNCQYYKKPLIPLINFAPIFSKFKGKKIGFVVFPGNVGDWLIEESAIQLFNYFNINFSYVNNRKNPFSFNESVCNEVDEFVCNGGGNLGELYKNNQKIRQELFIYNKPITILPQTFTNSVENLPYKKVWVRERRSLCFHADAELAPDLALGYVYEGIIPQPELEEGIWLREDVEKTQFNKKESLGDPAKICKSPKEYILLASKYKKIITNRLHFAIAGLIAGREVTLIPNSYFKNKSVWDIWLKHLGCKWSFLS